MTRALLITCEHGGNRVPATYRELLRGARDVLDTHRGWDPGALTLARELASAFDTTLYSCETTRLLIDANRSLGHHALFSEWSRVLTPEERQRVVERWWRPHWDAAEAFVRAHRSVLHLSMHSFTPVWNGSERRVDVGFLYDPKRRRELELVDAVKSALATRRPDLRLRRNQPYRGTADGLIPNLRRRFDERRYVGLELEVSQRFPLGPRAEWRRLRGDLLAGLRDGL